MFSNGFLYTGIQPAYKGLSSDLFNISPNAILTLLIWIRKRAEVFSVFFVQTCPERISTLNIYMIFKMQHR